MIAISSELPLSELLRIYHRNNLNLSDESAQQIQVAINVFSRFLGAVPTVADLTKENLIEFMRWYCNKQGVAAPTANSKRKSLLTLWNYAASVGITAVPPKIPKVPEPERIPIVITFEQFERLLAAANALPGCWDGVPAGLYWRIFLLICWDSGCRLAEVMAAKLTDVDLQTGWWHVPPENRKGRRKYQLYRLHSQTLQAIRESIPPQRELLFPYPKCRRQVFIDFGKLLEAAGLPNDRWHKSHCIRRTAESYGAAARGVEWAAEAVGHSPAVARRHYINPQIAPGPCLSGVLPRPKVNGQRERQLTLFDLD